MLYRLALVASLCFSAASAALAQHARSTRAEQGFVAPRHLHELRTTPPNTGARVVGDLDGDGDLDLLMLERPDPLREPRAVQTWLNGGRGDFQLAASLSLPGWSSDQSFGVASILALADVDGDGVLDLAYERRGPGVVPMVVLVHPGLGDGGFGAPWTVTTSSPNAAAFATGDCDGDGDADLLVTEWINPGVRTLTWWRLEGSAFVAGASWIDPTPGGMWLVVTLDLDADGVADAAATNGSYDANAHALQIFRTVNGAPTLVALVPLSAEIQFNLRLLRGDLDGDGDEDALVTFIDSEPGVGSRFHFQPIRNDSATFTALPLQTFMRGTATGDPGLDNGALADWDGDGDLDYVSPDFAWMENDGAGSFALAARQRAAASGPVQLADLNGDGHLDVLASWMCFFGDGTFPVRTSIGDLLFNSSAFETWSVLEDREGDGDLDLVGRTYVHRNRGDGTFEGLALPDPPAPSPFGYPTEIGWADFDGDRFRDKVISFSFGTTFERTALYLGTEAGPHVLSPTHPSPNRMTVDGVSLPADLDDDGDLDILMQDGYWRNDGTGYFGGGKVALYSGLPLLARDYDGDGDHDLLLGRGGSLILRVKDVGAAFHELSLGSYHARHRHAFVDADEDGDLDLAVVTPTSDTLVLHEQLPGGDFAAPFGLGAPDVEDPVSQMDVDGDGRLDLVGFVSGPSAARLVAWPRADGLKFRARREWMVYEAPIAFGDLDRDGDEDFVGRTLFENFRFYGAEDGVTVQYGHDAATSGTGGRHPVLGSGGPVRPGKQLKLVIAGGRGGASGVLVRGTARDDLAQGGYRSLVAAPEVVRSFVLGGTAGAAGAGSIVLRAPITGALVGLTFEYQGILVDPDAAAGLSATNGLEIRYGDWPTTR